MAICEKKLISYIKTEINPYGRPFEGTVFEFGCKVIDYIENMNKVGEWIPCSERLPEKAGKYLVTMIEGCSVHTSVRRFNPKPKHPEQNEPIFTKYLPYYSGWERATRGVIAWMPLPAPYDMRKQVEV